MPTIAHDARAVAALAKGVGGGPCFQADPGLLLELLENLPNY